MCTSLSSSGTRRAVPFVRTVRENFGPLRVVIKCVAEGAGATDPYARARPEITCGQGALLVGRAEAPRFTARCLQCPETGESLGPRVDAIPATARGSTRTILRHTSLPGGRLAPPVERVGVVERHVAQLSVVAAACPAGVTALRVAQGHLVFFEVPVLLRATGGTVRGRTRRDERRGAHAPCSR